MRYFTMTNSCIAHTYTPCLYASKERRPVQVANDVVASSLWATRPVCSLVPGCIWASGEQPKSGKRCGKTLVTAHSVLVPPVLGAGDYWPADRRHSLQPGQAPSGADTKLASCGQDHAYRPYPIKSVLYGDSRCRNFAYLALQNQKLKVK